MLTSCSKFCWWFLAVALCAVSWTPTACATPPRELHYDLRVDVPLSVGVGGLWLGSSLASRQLTADRCRWCEDNGFDRWARERLRWDDHRKAIATASDVAAFYAAPALALGSMAVLAAKAGALRNLWLDAWFVLEAVGVSVVATRIFKFSTARLRPDGSGRPLSFYSGHANMAFAIAAATGTVASLRGYRGSFVMWTVGLLVATFAAYARVAADKHHLTDVLVGSAMGSAIGAGLPWLLHRPRARACAGQWTVGPAGVFWTWRN